MVTDWGAIAPMRGGEVSFGGFVLNQLPFVVDSVQYHDYPQTNVTRFDRITRPGSIVSRRHLEERIVAISGRVVARSNFSAARRTPAGMHRMIDRLKKALSLGPTTFFPGAVDGRYFLNAELVDKASFDWPEISWPEMEYKINLLIPDPLAYANASSSKVDNTALSLVSGSEYAKSILVTPGGNAPARPTISITIPAATSYGISQIEISNESLGGINYLKIIEGLVAGDIVVIDTQNHSVQVNGSEHIFSGNLELTLDPRLGDNTIRIGVLATSTPTLNCSIAWNARYF